MCVWGGCPHTGPTCSLSIGRHAWVTVGGLETVGMCSPGVHAGMCREVLMGGVLCTVVEVTLVSTGELTCGVSRQDNQEAGTH